MSDLFDFKDKIVLVTGASRGIGAAVAKDFARRGAHVILLARTQGALEEIDDQIQAEGGSATLMPMDLRRLEKIDQLGPAIFEKFGKLDIFVGNAGVLGKLMPAHQLDLKDFERTLAVNFMANVRLVRTLDPLLRAAPQGRIIFTGSGQSESPDAYWGGYGASKAALHAFVCAYRKEIAKTKIKLGIIDPGVVDTKMLAEAYPGGYTGQSIDPTQISQKYVDFCVK